jgi:hypothetical protein
MLSFERICTFFFLVLIEVYILDQFSWGNFTSLKRRALKIVHLFAVSVFQAYLDFEEQE